jgi:uncharacterized protein (DUF849 family)
MAPDPRERIALIDAWAVLPDFASVNLSETGAVEVCAALRRRRIDIEAGVWSVDDAHRLIAAGLAPRCLRILVEAQPADAGGAVTAAHAIDAALDDAGAAVPRLHHGEGAATWAVLDAALARGRDVRVGLEDTLVLPDGRRTRNNAELVAEAVRLVHRRGHRPVPSAC